MVAFHVREASMKVPEESNVQQKRGGLSCAFGADAEMVSIQDTVGMADDPRWEPFNTN